MIGVGRIAAGSGCGAGVAALLARTIRPLFHPPTGGIGWTTVHAYPKGWDYAVVALLFGGAFLGGLLAGRGTVSEAIDPPSTVRGRTVALAALAVFVTMLFVHDHPYHPMDPFHEGEHLTPGFLFRAGERPYRDVFVLHGLATDGGLDALVLGDPPSPRRTRRLETLLDGAALALLVPIAAELAVTPAGLAAAAAASLCGVAAGQLPVLPWFRLAPLLIAVWGLLRYARSGRAAPLLTAFAAAALGVLWSLDTGTYAMAATAVTMLALRAMRLEAKPLPLRRVALLALAALALPIVLLLAAGAGLREFFIDSFVIIPRSIDAIWSLPARTAVDLESARYYLPPLFYGFLLALGVRLRDRRMLIVAIASIFLFRTAAGRVAWSHTRFAVPLFGAAVAAFILEPLWRRRRWIAAAVVTLTLAVVVEVPANLVAGAKMLAGWHARQSHAGLVPYPFATGKGIYTSPANAADLAALNGFIASVTPPGGTFLDFSGERALYYLLQRKPPLRCPDINMLSAPPLLAEAMAQLEAHPPSCVVVKGIEINGSYDGVANAQRVPVLARWIEVNYPRRFQIGRFVVAAR
jgi:hypothetical protein